MLKDIEKINETPEQKNVLIKYQETFVYEELATLLEDGKKIKIENENQAELMETSGTIRKKLKKIRNVIENRRKELKEGINLQGKAIDGIANYFKGIIIPIEKHLEDQENYIENLKQKQIDELAEKRNQELGKYIDVSFYELGTMPEPAYSQLLKNSKLAYETEQQAIIQAEKEQKEREREQQLEQERIKKENERLKKEAEIREKKEAAQRKKEVEKLNVERKKREDAEAEARKIKEEQERKKREEQRRQAEEERRN